MTSGLDLTKIHMSNIGGNIAQLSCPSCGARLLPVKITTGEAKGEEFWKCTNAGCSLTWSDAELVGMETPYREASDIAPPAKARQANPSMTRSEFDIIVEELDDYIKGLRDYKESEYASTADTLANFHNGGRDLDEPPSLYAIHLMHKHWGAVLKAVRTGEFEWCFRTDDGEEGLKQRLADMRNYIDLLFALLEEESG